MSAKTPRVVRDKTSFIFIGQELPLNKKTPRGLFEACNGNLYLVVTCDDEKHAISLNNPDRAALSSRKLSRKSLEFGMWWGAARLTITDVVSGTVPSVPGIIKIKDEWAMLRCLDERGKLRWQRVAWLPFCDRDHVGKYFDGWELEVREFDMTVFTRSPNGECDATEQRMELPRQCLQEIDVKFRLGPGNE